MQETFWTLLHDTAHWEFEIFLMVLFDGVIGCLFWPYIKKHWTHHIDRDNREEKEMKKISGTTILTSNPLKPEEYLVSEGGCAFIPLLRWGEAQETCL